MEKNNIKYKVSYFQNLETYIIKKIKIYLI